MRPMGKLQRLEYAPANRDVLTTVTWRLVPLLFMSYVIAYIDRINVSFAKLQLRQLFGIDKDVFNSVYGLGAGLFFIGYFIFEVPSNLLLQRIGARVWIARDHDRLGRDLGRHDVHEGHHGVLCDAVLPGRGRGGLLPRHHPLPDLLVSLAPARRTIALFATGGLLAGVVGSPVSGAVLGLSGVGGLAGWQWLFLLEGIPAVLMGLVILLLLPDGPKQARWLSEDDRAAIQALLDEDAAGADAPTRHRLADAFTSGRVWLLCLLYFLLNVGGYGYEMWLPSIVESFSGKGHFVVGLINAIPYLAAGIIMLLAGRHSDHTGERRWHVAVAAAASAAGFAASAYFHNPYLAMAALTIAFAGLKSTLGPFWRWARHF